MAKKPVPSKRKQPGFVSRLRGNFLTGLVIVLPVALTIWMIWAFIGFVDNSVLPLVPEGYKPQSGWRGYGVFVFLNASFEKACMVEYPRRGIWAIAFVSTTTKGEVLAKSGEDGMMSIFLPTTPNPTSGFLLFVPTKDVVVLDMDVEAAAKLVISAGLVMPPTKEEIAAGKAKPRGVNQK